MSKYINYLMLCSILLLYCCWDRNPMSEGNTSTSVATTLTADEEVKFNALKDGFDTMIKNLENKLTNEINLDTNEKNRYQNIINKYPGFIDWLSKNPQKKKELANAFTTAYKFLDDQRIKQSSPLTTEQLIINTINCKFPYQNNAQCNDNNYVYSDTLKTNIPIVFSLLLTEIDHKNTNEEIFEEMIQEQQLLKPNFVIASLIGIDRLEVTIRRDKLNDSQRQGLDFLKAALNDKEKLLTFLRSNEDKVKAVLEHIDSELSKCGQDDAKKNTFKDVINSYFNIINKQKLDEFKDQVTSGC